MTAVVFVVIAWIVIILALLLLALRRLWWVALPALILALLAVIAEAPRAAATLWGERVPGIVAATQESLRLETARSSGVRTSHYEIHHRFGAIVCYRAAGAPGWGAGAPIDPAIKAAIGEAETAADRFCRQAPGTRVLRQTEVRLDEATYDATLPGRSVTLVLLRPFGILEWAWPVDAPLLPMLARPSWGSTGPTTRVGAEILSITIDQRGRSLLSRRAQDFAVPVAYVRLRYAPPGHPAGVEGIDTVDAASVASLVAGGRVDVLVAESAPRKPMLIGVSRSYWWRNPATDIALLLGLVIGVVIVVLLVRRARRRRRGALPG